MRWGDVIVAQHPAARGAGEAKRPHNPGLNSTRVDLGCVDNLAAAGPHVILAKTGTRAEENGSRTSALSLRLTACIEGRHDGLRTELRKMSPNGGDLRGRGIEDAYHRAAPPEVSILSDEGLGHDSPKASGQVATKLRKNDNHDGGKDWISSSETQAPPERIFRQQERPSSHADGFNRCLKSDRAIATRQQVGRGPRA